MNADVLVVDSFAGGGGASSGIEAALGRPVDIAINHDAEALAMHAANHPDTLHLSKNIWQVDPIEVIGRRPVDLAWFSPDCKHFSKAKGGRPVKRNIRDLAWVVVLWAKRVRPRVIMLENVEEFREWGPVRIDGRPCPDRKGETFDRWCRELRRLGYKLDWRELRACDYGAPTIRKRLFLIARRDGQPIVWPDPTHGPGLLPYRTATDIIDWSLPCPSIFLSKEEGRAIGVKRPLADATLRRIARGVMRYVVNCADPFILPITHRGDDRVHGIGEPLRTVTTAHRGELALVAPTLVSVAHGYGGGRREYRADEPLGTVSAGGGQHALVAPTIVGCGGRAGQSRPRSGDEPLATITSKSDAYLVAAFLAQHNTGVTGHDVRAPVSTITQRGTQQQVVACHLLNLKGGDRRDGRVDAPAPTITAGGGHVAAVSAFLIKYYGADQDPRLDEPLHTVTTRDRFGLVTVDIGGEPFALIDIGMRMLSPRELFRAQGFDDDYIVDPPYRGRPLTKTAQIRMCGNSVSPKVARALVAANLGVSAASAGEVAA